MKFHKNLPFLCCDRWGLPVHGVAPKLPAVWASAHNCVVGASAGRGLGATGGDALQSRLLKVPKQFMGATTRAEKWAGQHCQPHKPKKAPPQHTLHRAAVISIMKYHRNHSHPTWQRQIGRPPHRTDLARSRIALFRHRSNTTGDSCPPPVGALHRRCSAVCQRHGFG
jgi:hypothetical protein